MDVTARTRRIASATVTLAFFALVVWLVGDELREVDPHEILAALRRLSTPRLAAACALTVAGYAVVASYDRLSVRHAGVRLPAPLNFAIAFVSYAFNFNLGAMVGALAFRYRLYTRAGVETQQVAAIAACSIATNWCGCLTVIGAMLLADPSALERALGLSALVGRALGVLALAPVAAYALATRFWRKPVRIRGSDYRLPGSRLALAQIVLGSAYWLIVPGVLYALCPPEASIPYSQIATAYGLAALGGVVVRVPAGLGVIEAVFLEIFRGTAGATPILAMLLAWRALFLLAPLLIAGIVVLVLESRSAKTSSRGRGDAGAAQRVAHSARTPAPAARRR